MAHAHVLLATEGTYPFHPGGVSVWCDTLVHQLSEVEFTIFAVAMNPYVAVQFDLPTNVRDLVAVPLWGMQDPSEHRRDLTYSEIFLKKQRTGQREVSELFLPSLQQFLNALVSDHPGALGEAITQMYRYFRTYDYQTTFKTQDVWDVYKTWLLSAARQGYWSEPSVFESVQGLGWIYHFLIVLNTAVPTVDLVHSSAAAFCGMVGMVSKLEHNTPYLLTEHGVYLREQYLAIGRSNMTPFSKRFLIALVKAISRENLHLADQLVPVCAFNGRWERVLGADGNKIRVIYNGVNGETFHPAPSVDRTPIEILAVARIDPNKDLETLIRAIHIVRSFDIAVHVRVLGSVSVESYHEKIVALIRQLGLQDVVELKGHTASMGEAYRMADICVQSSVTEAFPYSVIEAMMSGVPMVATDVGGTREALGTTGILVPSRDPAQLALGIALLAQDPDLRRRLGQEARTRARQYFEISHAMQTFLRLYQRWQKGLVGAPPSVRSAPQPALLHVTRALALERIQKPKLALQELDQALSDLGHHPAATALLLEMSHLEMSMGEHERAYQHLLKSRLLVAAFRHSPSRAS
jgi:glycosyltransferase involved in cell wall biosynthesis